MLEAEPGERDAILERVRRDDESLADELAQLLAREPDADAQGFLEVSALPNDASLAGQAVGSYTPDRLIGEGGMGSVWLAHRSDGRYEGQVAVKFLNFGAPSAAAAPNGSSAKATSWRAWRIARLLDAGVAAGGQPFLVLEYIEGEVIDRWCDLHTLGVEARVRACFSMCSTPSRTPTAT